jgi:hypothetical protein
LPLKQHTSFQVLSPFDYYAPHHSKCLDTSETPHQTEVLCDCGGYLFFSTSGFSEILKKQSFSEKTRSVSARLDKCLQRVEAPKTQQLNMRRPEDGADVRRNAQGTVM